ncbi:MAG: hypothetical protein FJ224_07735 [Lentisphaerae bacterium]|nr:hypothetical protein [Lentisphaerota bacterium]
MCSRFFAALVFAVSAISAAALAEGPGTVLVIPSRYKLVQMALDVASIRRLGVVAYNVDAKTGEASLYAWQPQAKWRRIDDAAYKADAGLGVSGAATVIVRDIAGIPSLLETAPAWGSAAKWVDAMDLAGLFNTLNETLSFKSEEWLVLGERYGLQLKDMNEERRRYGRYGRLGQGPLPPPRTEAEVMPVPEAVPMPVPEPVPEASVESALKALDGDIPEPVAPPVSPGRKVSPDFDPPVLSPLDK